MRVLGNVFPHPPTPREGSGTRKHGFEVRLEKLKGEQFFPNTEGDGSQEQAVRGGDRDGYIYNV